MPKDLLFLVTDDHISYIASKRMAASTTRNDIWVFGMCTDTPIKSFSLIPTDRFISLFGKKGNNILKKLGESVEWELLNEIKDIEAHLVYINKSIDRLTA